MILTTLLTLALVAAPPSPRAVQEHQATIARRHAQRAARAAYNTPCQCYPVCGCWPTCECNPWVYAPPGAGQLPPGWDAAYGPFLSRMAGASW
jgi:hypothetical protein